MNKKLVLKIMLLMLTVGVIFTGCGRKENKVIQIKGSDTILNLTQAVVQKYNGTNQKAKISVTGGGSGTGIAALVNKTIDIAMASREIKDKELQDAKKHGVNPKEVVIGFDAISIIVNKANGVSNLTLEQLRDIYMGKITNWKEIGGADKSIVVLSRDSSSGTHVYFKEHVLRQGNSKGSEEFDKSVLFLPSNESIKQQVATVDGSIGYVGLGYLDGTIKVLNINGVAPNLEDVINKTYPIARAVYWYIANENDETVKSLVDYMLSPEGQKIVKDEGFVPVK